jgi:alpha-1,2-mannosyltransferase
VTAIQPRPGPLELLGASLRIRPGRVYPFSVPLLVFALAALVVHLGDHFLDLEVYRLGVRTWLSGGDLYGSLPTTSAGIALPFIYPPFAALLLVPLTVSGWACAWISMLVISLASLCVTLYVLLRRLWPSGGRAGALAAGSVLLPLSLVLEPVLQTFEFGQLNLLLMAMVAVDCLVPRTRWPRGLLVGLAAAIKLTPGVFVLYFVLRRDYRSALVAALVAAAATGASALVAPAASLRYWIGGPAAGVSGSPFFTNQTFQAVLVRAGLSGLDMKAAWLLASALLLCLATPAIRRAPEALALVATAGVGLLVSPTSWSHHWVWIAPALLVTGVIAGRSRSRAWALATAVLVVAFVVAPFHFLPHDHELELTWTPAQQVVGATYVIVTAALYAALWLAWRRRPAPAPGSPERPEQPGPPERPERPEPPGSPEHPGRPRRRSGRLGGRA